MTEIDDIFFTGLVVRGLDRLLEEDNIHASLTIMKYLKPAVSSEEDAAFGSIIGELVGRLSAAINVGFNREMNELELEIIGNEIQRRSLEIRSKIREYANL